MRAIEISVKGGNVAFDVFGNWITVQLSPHTKKLDLRVSKQQLCLV